MNSRKPLKPGEKILFIVFAAFLALAAVGYVILETVRSHSTEPMFVSRASFDLSAAGKHGSMLFRTEGCTACHRAMRSGTNNALSLDGIGSRRTREWIERFLHDPEATYPTKTFDHGFGAGKEAGYVQSLPAQDLRDIAIFLSELKAEQGSALAKEPPPESSGFIDAMVKMWAPESWKTKYEDIRVRLKREAEQKQQAEQAQQESQGHD